MKTYPNFVQRLYDAAARRRKVFPAYTCRASEIGGDCIRQMAYGILHPELAVLHSVDLQLIFDEGNLHEEDVKIKLAMAGVYIHEQQRALSWKTDTFHITGHVDGVFPLEEGERVVAVPLEIKSMSEHIWNSIFFRGPAVYAWDEVKGGFQTKPWLRKYFGQISCYIKQKDTDRGVFLCKNKTTGAIGQVNVERDEAYLGQLVSVAEELTRYIRREELPPKIAFDPDVCGRCRFADSCVPDQIAEPVAYTAEPVIVGWAEQRWQNADARKLYEEADKKLKAWAKANDWIKFQVPGWFFEKKKHGKGIRVDIKPAAGGMETLEKAEQATRWNDEKNKDDDSAAS